MPLKDIWRIFISSTPGRLGIFFLMILLAISIYVIVAYPLDYGRRIWSNPLVWADMPKNAPPAWLPGESPHRLLEAKQPIKVLNGGKLVFYTFSINHNRTQPPSFLAFGVEDVVYYQAPPLLTLSLRRPDDKEVMLYHFVVSPPYPGELPPIYRYKDTPYRILLSAHETVLEKVSEFLRREYGVEMKPAEIRGKLENILFGVPTSGMPTKFQPLTGTYTVVLSAIFQDSRDKIGKVRMVFGGTAYGLLGTDNLGRDLMEGLLFGFPIALAIGLTTALFTTILGSSLGIVSGYSGGKTDTLIQRLADIVNNIPLLPILIFLIFILGSRLWLIILLLVAFSWPGLTIMIRSMVLQLRFGQLVEATRALGASPWRIMFRHIAFQIAPYLLAQMIFFTPGAILAEAGLSFLGLGDPSLPTWGQILEQGFRTGAIYLGYWWWVVPPGLLVVLTALTFVLITLGLEPVVNPRLR